jgi:hypothetical protein
VDADMVLKAGVILGVLAGLWVLGDWRRYRRRAVRVGRALRLVHPAPVSPTSPPIERIAADARRISAQLRHPPPGIPVAKLRGWEAAYDDVLVAACHALGLEEQLSVLPDGVRRDLERERVERMLQAAGFLLRPSA